MNDNNNFEKLAIQEARLKYYYDGHAKYDPNLYAEILHPEWRDY